MAIEVLNWLKLPGSLGIERDVPMELRNEHPDFQYDFRTLFYDAIFVPQSRSICLICPKFLNLSAVVKDGQFSSKDQRLKPRFKCQYKRYDEIWLRCSGVPDSLRFRFDSFDCEVPVGIQDKETFRGLRCAVLKSKDNELTWIKDWAEYHVKVHGLQGLVFFDNASEKYSTEDVHNALLKINGLEKVRVLSAPFPFGAKRISKNTRQFKCLTLGLLNIARLRYFQSAAAVLCTDVDELVAPTPEGSVFALAERSPFGYIVFRGHWRYPQPMNTQHVRHGDHVYASTNDRFIGNKKYCICPKGLLRFLRWSTHSVMYTGFLKNSAIRKAFRNALVKSRIEYWHCRKISTNWKYLRDVPQSNQLKLDPGAKRVLDRVFGSGP